MKAFVTLILAACALLLSASIQAAPNAFNKCGGAQGRADAARTLATATAVAALCARGDPADGIGPAAAKYYTASYIVGTYLNSLARALDSYGSSNCPYDDLTLPGIQTAQAKFIEIGTAAASACPHAAANKNTNKCGAMQHKPRKQLEGGTQAGIAQTAGAMACAMGNGNGNMPAAVNQVAVDRAARMEAKKFNAAITRYGNDCPISVPYDEAAIQSLINDLVADAANIAADLCDGPPP